MEFLGFASSMSFAQVPDRKSQDRRRLVLIQLQKQMLLGEWSLSNFNCPTEEASPTLPKPWDPVQPQSGIFHVDYSRLSLA